MQGGRILGEGVDGCVFTEPSWPCSSQFKLTDIPSSHNSSIVSKIVPLSDKEDTNILMATKLLGPLAFTFIANLRGECSPANSKNPPKSSDQSSLKASQIALQDWSVKGQACESIQKSISNGKGISDSHKVLFIQRYSATVNEWLSFKKFNETYIAIHQISKAVPSFLINIQRLYQNPIDHLYHIDLHVGNLFVRSSKAEIHLGISDFGHCLLRQESPLYLTKYIAPYQFFSGYSQVPLEARLLNYCFQTSSESLDPKQLVLRWRQDPEVLKSISKSKDAFIITIDYTLAVLLDCPLFIEMVQELQSLSMSIKTPSYTLTKKQIQILEFILSRYLSWSPINTLTESLLLLKHPVNLQNEVKRIAESEVKHTKIGTSPSGIKPFIVYILQLLLLPYLQKGVPLIKALMTVQEADISGLFNVSR